MTINDNSETPGCVIYSIGFGFAVGALVDRARGRKVTLFRAPTQGR
jgi:hypothetical protein